MSDMHDMAERIAEREELDRLRAEVRQLRAQVAEHELREEMAAQMAVMQAMRPMPAYWRQREQAAMNVLPDSGIPRGLGFSAIFGTTWP